MLHVTGRLSGAHRLYTGVELGTAQVYTVQAAGAGSRKALK